MKQTLAEIKFALENGFTEIKKGTEKDGSITYQGTFGYVAVTSEEAKQIDTLIAEYVTVEEKKETKTFEEVLTNLFGSKLEIKNAQIKSLLNEKVLEVKKEGKGINATYSFKVENDTDNTYPLSAAITGKGKWWVKRGRSMR